MTRPTFSKTKINTKQTMYTFKIKCAYKTTGPLKQPPNETPDGNTGEGTGRD